MEGQQITEATLRGEFAEDLRELPDDLVMIVEQQAQVLEDAVRTEKLGAVVALP